MSPSFTAAFPWTVDLLGGRQSARTIHFFVTWLLLLFLFVHVAMVAMSGFWSRVRGMITGIGEIQRRSNESITRRRLIRGGAPLLRASRIGSGRPSGEALWFNSAPTAVESTVPVRRSPMLASDC